MFNSNSVHNILNALIFIVGLASVIGCVETAAGYDCSQSFIGPTYGAYAAMLFGALKVLINIGRDGLGGLFKQQPPVASNLTTVVVASNAEAGPAKVAVTGAMAATKK